MYSSAISSTLILLGKDHYQPSPHTFFFSFQTETVNPLNSSFLTATIPSLFLCTWLIYVPHTSGPTQHLFFGDWYSNHNAPAFHTCGRIPFLPKSRCYFSFCRSSIFLVHLSTDGHGLLLPLGITDNSAAVMCGTTGQPQLSLLCGTCSEVELLDQRVILGLETMVFSTVVAPLCIWTSSCLKLAISPHPS